jgi:membrane-associated phospholipid phosphatase
MIWPVFGIKNNHKVAYYALAEFFAAICMNTTKMIYQEPRPFQLDPDVKNLEFSCSKEYGNISGHALYASTCAFTIAFDNSGSPLSVLMAATYACIMSYSRIILGTHSLN